MYTTSLAERQRLETQAALQIFSTTERANLLALGFPEAGQILSLGCGTGATEASLVRPGQRWLGVESNPVHAAHARQRARPDGTPLFSAVFEQDAARNLPGQNTAVYARLLLRHLPQPLLVLDAALQSLAPGGRLFIVAADDSQLVLACDDAELQTELAPLWRATREAAFPGPGLCTIGAEVPALLTMVGGTVTGHRRLRLDATTIGSHVFAVLIEPFFAHAPDEARLRRLVKRWVVAPGAHSSWDLFLSAARCEQS